MLRFRIEETTWMEMSASMRRRQLAPALLLALLGFSCGGGGTSSSMPTAPVPAPPAPVPPTVANLAGTWSGTLESSNFSTRVISLEAFQSAGNCVDGAWATEPREWAGAISGFTSVGSFSGSISFEGPSGCGGAGTISGDVSVDTLTWTSTGFSAGNCPQGTPQSVVVKLRRQ